MINDNSRDEYDIDIFSEKILIFLVPCIPAFKFAALKHNCLIFGTELLLLHNTAVASLEDNRHRANNAKYSYS